MALLETNNLACERDDRLLFAALDWRADGGELWQLVGVNGSGKTSLLKILAGLLWPSAGKVDWRLADSQGRPADWRERLGYIGHLSGLRDELTAEENLAWLAALHGDELPALLAALPELGLAGFTDVPLAQLSAGQKHRVALARLWGSDKQVWLLDEPFSAIDAAGVTLLENRLGELAAADKLVIYSSHHRVNQEACRIELGNGCARVVA